MRGSVGLVIGLVLGAGAMYLALEQPWQRAPESVVVSGASSAADADPSEPTKKPSKRRRSSRVGARAGGAGESGGAEALEETAPLVALSAAERRLIWRGAEVTIPAATHDFSASAAGSARMLDDDEIAATVRSQSKPIVDCMVSAAAGAELRATVTIKMLVDGRGRVTKHRVQAPQYLFDHGLTPCADRAVQRLRFPAVGAFTLVTAPFDLG